MAFRGYLNMDLVLSGTVSRERLTVSSTGSTLALSDGQAPSRLSGYSSSALNAPPGEPASSRHCIAVDNVWT